MFWKSKMVSISVDKEPADTKVIIFRLLSSLEDFISSRNTIIHIIVETIATMLMISVDIIDSPFIYIIIGFTV